MTRDDLKPAKGLMFGVLFSIPIWFGVFMLTTWLINR